MGHKDVSPSLAIILTSIAQGVYNINQRNNALSPASLFLSRFQESIEVLLKDNGNLSRREKANVEAFSCHLFSTFRQASNYLEES